MPTAVVLAGGTLEVDFATHRSGFPIAQFSPSDAPPFIRADRNPLAPADAPFSTQALFAMIEREYPGFSFKPTGPQTYELSIAACRSERP